MNYPLIIITALSILLLGCSNPSAENETPLAQHATAFAKEKITTGSLEATVLNSTIECTGKIEIPPSDVYSIHSRTEGFVKALTKLPGDKVRKGERLVEIENPDFIGMQRQAYELRHQYTTARSQYLRQNELNEKNATTAKQFEQSLGNFRVARSNYTGLLIELESIGIAVDTSSGYPEYQRSVVISAPVTGQVSAVSTNMGTYVESHDELMTITSEAHIHLELFVLERDIERVSIGQKVRFSTTAGGSKTFDAEIVKINSVADRQSGTVMVHCHIDSDESQFKGGTFAQAWIESDPVEITGLPREAAVRIGDEWFGFIVSGEEYQQVKLQNATLHDDIIAFEPIPDQLEATWVTGGAYYIQ